MNHLADYGYFLAQSVTIIAVIFILLGGGLAIIARAKDKGESGPGKLQIKSLNERYKKLKHSIEEKTLNKFDLKSQLKAAKKNLQKENKQQKLKAKQANADNDSSERSVFILKFHGDIRASAVESLSQEISAILLAAKTGDQVLLELESGGGMVNSYGLAAAQLQRLRQANIHLTIAVDKIAASGGYMMACVADHVLAAPFAIVGSIGVLAQIPNFHRWLDKHNIDFEQITAGKYKRTLTMFGKNDTAGRAKMTADIEQVHQLFQAFIKEYRPQLDMSQVATGEYWYGSQALDLKLVDELITAEDWLLKAHQQQQKLYQVSFKRKRSLSQRLSNKATAAWDQVFSSQKSVDPGT